MLIILTIFALLLIFKWWLKKDSQTGFFVNAKIAPIGSDFRWEDCEPLRLRPFVGKISFNPLMGVRNMSQKREELFLIENTYLETTNRRKSHLGRFEHKMIHCNHSEMAQSAVREFYSMAVSFLANRYPQYFKLDSAKGTIHNLINDDVFPLSGRNRDVKYLLRVLTANIEEDVIIMLKDHPENEDAEYILRASLTGSPAGFDPSHNFDRPVSFIHNPVPQYEARLFSPMHRFFNKIASKDIWQRANWSIQTNRILFKLEDHHGRCGDDPEEQETQDIDFENACFMRCERQLITRLPQTKAVLMLVRTYLTPLKTIKEESHATEMAQAIESLPEDLALYKRRHVWGKAVCEYLRT
ncbi:hypothetical protein METBIDRAFT_9043 [Metschnikowia bicuspidata var. bicuspidata NRRL YB-4993]|uniref:Uncharacterized protein n=1 Tax=Metschnikowia bicuspidata var. bicuspidata NRRL YB-4993 TaxID=869754 RepID=A0A1A0HFM6_9ASCO|nr:hypothetical protein METBIDRAFT_9043 [Metschnikowia bicuspidata var. bicuspidata NRRL YB-4993]OBA22663.1 hypothetical protein METBIDRAFT_9043 [Metschnikowia bicuspidata var. bicuspidata NRRL YB-4993]